MLKTSDTYGLTLDNVPLANLRWEFDHHRECIARKDWQDALLANRPMPTRYLAWGGMPDDFISLLLIRAISGIEAYLPAAFTHAAFARGVLDQALAEKLSRPFAEIKRKSVVLTLYDKMPALVCPEFSLRLTDHKLWMWISGFYAEVRNPLFHGRLLSKNDVVAIHRIFERLNDVYRWVDSIADPKDWLFGAFTINASDVKKAEPDARANDPACHDPC
jgi:hypothetical protein